MSLKDEIAKGVPEVLRERYGASDSQLRASAQGALRTFSETVQSQRTVLAVPEKPFVPLHISEETVTLQSPALPDTPRPPLSSPGSSLPTFQAFVGVAGIVRQATLAGTVV